MIRLLVASGVFAVAGFAGIAAAPAASATPLCQVAMVDTVATNPTTVGPVCVPYSDAPECLADQPFSPFATAYVQVCIPAL